MTNKTKPTYYMKGTIETIDFIKEVVSGLDGVSGFYVGNIIKYISRHADKGNVEDLKKASVYLDWLIRHRERTEESASLQDDARKEDLHEPASLQDDAQEEELQKDTKLNKQEELKEIEKEIKYLCIFESTNDESSQSFQEYQALTRRRRELLKELETDIPSTEVLNKRVNQLFEEQLHKLIEDKI